MKPVEETRSGESTVIWKEYTAVKRLGMSLDLDRQLEVVNLKGRHTATGRLNLHSSPSEAQSPALTYGECYGSVRRGRYDLKS